MTSAFTESCMLFGVFSIPVVFLLLCIMKTPFLSSLPLTEETYAVLSCQHFSSYKPSVTQTPRSQKLWPQCSLDCTYSFFGVTAVKNRQYRGQSCACLFRVLSLFHIMQCMFTYQISCGCFGWLHRLNLRPTVNISVTFAVLATMLNQRAGRRDLIREAFFQLYKSLHLANRGFRELLLLVRDGLLDLIQA